MSSKLELPHLLHNVTEIGADCEFKACYERNLSKKKATVYQKLPILAKLCLNIIAMINDKKLFSVMTLIIIMNLWKFHLPTANVSAEQGKNLKGTHSALG